MATKTKKPDNRPAAENRRARYDYFIEDTLEAGIVLEAAQTPRGVVAKMWI